MDSAATEGLVYFAIEAFLILLRFFMRWRAQTFRRLAMDDYLMVFALLLDIAGTVASSVVVFGAHGLANSGYGDLENKNRKSRHSMTAAERASLSPDSPEFRIRVQGSKAHLVGWTSFAALLWCLKLCWLFFYKRLGHRVHHMALKVNIGLGFCAVTFIALFCVILFGCVPFEKSWQINPDPGSMYSVVVMRLQQSADRTKSDFCYPASSRLQAWVMLVCDVATDLYITLIPLPMIWHVRIPKVYKVGLIIMFCGGILTMTFSIIRCVMILKSNEASTEFAAMWSDREALIAVIVTNVPVLVPLIRKMFWNISDKSVSSVSRTALESRPVHDMSRARGLQESGRVSTSSLPTKVPTASAESFYDSESDGADGSSTRNGRAR
ncbi:hypothetical protein L249_1007 [Ophiocordyceps polyrhachis-furcata BCC 54312]|uniref:Rhodopsin domain-containing protein n=1 Tax=Ophiocordyceps polyrhachis-furcata BCC 54312 TaxID=1330021 RepID=A0A367LE45_9HYPO|nr:hypothetical protein L249_1007 [Ophiocordyceps polyrhachis-furcata BCC 54312]